MHHLIVIPQETGPQKTIAYLNSMYHFTSTNNYKQRLSNFFQIKKNRTPSLPILFSRFLNPIYVTFLDINLSNRTIYICKLIYNLLQ